MSCARSRPPGIGSTRSRRSPAPGRRRAPRRYAAVYEQAGYRVLGAAPTGRAVRELKERAGIEESRTLDAWALKLAADPDVLRYAERTELGVRRVPAVMIIDEAGMAHTRLSAHLIDAAAAADVKVVAIGDSGQLSSVRAGGWLGAFTRTARLPRAARGHAPTRSARAPRPRIRAPRRARPLPRAEKQTAASSRYSPASTPASTPNAQRSSGGPPTATLWGASRRC